MRIHESDSQHDLFGQPPCRSFSRSLSLPPPPPEEPCIQELPPLARQEAAGGARFRQSRALVRALSHDDAVRGSANTQWKLQESPFRGNTSLFNSACSSSCRCNGRRGHIEWSSPCEDVGTTAVGSCSRSRFARSELPSPPPAGGSVASMLAASPSDRHAVYGWRRAALVRSEALRPLVRSRFALPSPPKDPGDVGSLLDHGQLRLPAAPSVIAQECGSFRQTCQQAASGVPSRCAWPISHEMALPQVYQTQQFFAKRQVAGNLRQRLLSLQAQCDAISRDFQRLHEASLPPPPLKSRAENSEKCRRRRMRREAQSLSPSAPLPLDTPVRQSSELEGAPTSSLRDAGSAWCSGHSGPFIAPNLGPSVEADVQRGKVAASTKWPWPASGDDSTSTAATATFDNALESTSVGTCGSVSSPPPTFAEVTPFHGGSSIGPPLNAALLARAETLSSEESTFPVFTTPRPPHELAFTRGDHGSKKALLLEAARGSSTPEFVIPDDFTSPASVGSNHRHSTHERSESPLSRATTSVDVRTGLQH